MKANTCEYNVSHDLIKRVEATRYIHVCVKVEAQLLKLPKRFIKI